MTDIEDARAWATRLETDAHWARTPAAREEYQRKADILRALIAEHDATVREMHARELHHFETEKALTEALAELDKIEDHAPHDIGGEIYTIPWAEGVVAGAKRIRRILSSAINEKGSNG